MFSYIAQTFAVTFLITYFVRLSIFHNIFIQSVRYPSRKRYRTMTVAKLLEPL